MRCTRYEPRAREGRVPLDRDRGIGRVRPGRGRVGGVVRALLVAEREEHRPSGPDDDPARAHDPLGHDDRAHVERAVEAARPPQRGVPRGIGWHGQPVGQRPRRAGADGDHGRDVVDRQRRHPRRCVGDVEGERDDLLVRVARRGEEGAVRLAADVDGDDDIERARVVGVGGGQAVGPVAGVRLPGAVAEVDRPAVGVDRTRDDVGADRLIEIGAPAGRELGAHRPLGTRRRGHGIDGDIEVQAHVGIAGSVEPDRGLRSTYDRGLRIAGVDRDAIARAVDGDPVGVAVGTWVAHVLPLGPELGLHGLPVAAPAAPNARRPGRPT